MSSFAPPPGLYPPAPAPSPAVASSAPVYFTDAHGQRWREVTRIWVAGLPVGQPRPRAVVRRFGNKVRADVYDPGTANEWKGNVKAAFFRAVPKPIAVSTWLDITVYLPRPKDHFGTGRNDGKLKPWAPLYCETIPDFDNIAKAICDALVDGRVLKDDAIVVEPHGPRKLYVSEERGWKTGAEIRIAVLEQGGAK